MTHGGKTESGKYMICDRLTAADLRAFLDGVPDAAVVILAFSGTAAGIELANHGSRVYLYSIGNVHNCGPDEIHEPVRSSGASCPNCMGFGWEPSVSGERRPCGHCQPA